MSESCENSVHIIEKSLTVGNLFQLIVSESCENCAHIIEKSLTMGNLFQLIVSKKEA